MVDLFATQSQPRETVFPSVLVTLKRKGESSHDPPPPVGVGAVGVGAVGVGAVGVGAVGVGAVGPVVYRSI